MSGNKQRKSFEEIFVLTNNNNQVDLVQNLTMTLADNNGLSFLIFRQGEQMAFRVLWKGVILFCHEFSYVFAKRVSHYEDISVYITGFVSHLLKNLFRSFLLLKREHTKRDINFARVYILLPKYLERVVYSCIVIIFKKKMDPTKPILDLYNDTGYEPTPRQSKPTRSQPTSSYKNNRAHQQQQQRQFSYSEIKQKYQELYHAYSQKVDKVNAYEEQMEYFRLENQKLKDQVHQLTDKNQQLNTTLLNKNIELEEAYRQLQEDIRRGQKNKRSDQALDRLEEGMREAIVSNFNLLREATLTELKNY